MTRFRNLVLEATDHCAMRDASRSEPNLANMATLSSLDATRDTADRLVELQMPAFMATSAARAALGDDRGGVPLSPRVPFRREHCMIRSPFLLPALAPLAAIALLVAVQVGTR